MTAGMKSSEFWMTIAVGLANALAPMAGADFPKEATLAVLAYILSRGLAKYQKP